MKVNQDMRNVDKNESRENEHLNRKINYMKIATFTDCDQKRHCSITKEQRERKIFIDRMTASNYEDFSRLVKKKTRKKKRNCHPSGLVFLVYLQWRDKELNEQMSKDNKHQR